MEQDRSADPIRQVRPRFCASPLEAVATSPTVADTLQTYRQDAREGGAITFGMNAIMRKGVGQVLRVGQRIAAGWSDTLYRLKNGCVDFFVWFVVNLPYLLIWVVLAGVVVWLCLRHRKKRRKKALLPDGDVAGKDSGNQTKEEK